MKKIHLIALATFAAWVIPRGTASEAVKAKSEYRFLKNKRWLEVRAEAYTATVRAEGSFLLSIKNTADISAAYLHCWKKYQRFPMVKYMRATVKQSDENKKILLKFHYFWNDGKVLETIEFNSRFIRISYTYTPFVAKNLAFLKGVFGVRKPPRQPESLELVGLKSDINSPGALIKLDKWSHVNRLRLKMLSVRGLGNYNVDFLVEGKSYLEIWQWPRMGIGYPRWDEPVYNPGESKTLKYTVEISTVDGKIIKDSPIEIKFLR
jgi:hypothetical protein